MKISKESLCLPLPHRKHWMWATGSRAAFRREVASWNAMEKKLTVKLQSTRSALWQKIDLIWRQGDLLWGEKNLNQTQAAFFYLVDSTQGRKGASWVQMGREARAWGASSFCPRWQDEGLRPPVMCVTLINCCVLLELPAKLPWEWDWVPCPISDPSTFVSKRPPRSGNGLAPRTVSQRRKRTGNQDKSENAVSSRAARRWAISSRCSHCFSHETKEPAERKRCRKFRYGKFSQELELLSQLHQLASTGFFLSTRFIVLGSLLSATCYLYFFLSWIATYLRNTTHSKPKVWLP